MIAMRTFVRPAIVIGEYLDDDGTVIPYGSRWADSGGDGPDDTYSVVRHPERFEPLVVVARALADHLSATYEVVRHDTANGIELRPTDPDAAALCFTFSSDHWWVQVLAGLTTELVTECGCDHCDCDVLVLIEDLEDSVASVVDGELSEWLNEGARFDPQYLFSVQQLAGLDENKQGSWSRSGAVDSEGARDALRAQFAGAPGRWHPWTLRR